jgi:5-methylcytosine-specific restriction enzyme subunit McrC
MVSLMTEGNSILIKNIYYMLTYAFQVLKHSNYDEISSESFENIYNLFAAILSKGIGQQLKQGLYREYIPRSDDLSLLRGKLNVNGTIDNKLQRKQLLTCEFDELSENNVFNQIFKTTMLILMKQPSVDLDKKKALKRDLLFFSNVDTIEPILIQWNRLRFSRNNQNYRMLLMICYFVLEGLLLSSEKGLYKMATFLDDQRMSLLYEKFVLEYFKFHHPCLQASASQVAWNLDDDVHDFLPLMQTDTTLSYKGISLIIDTKYYSRTMQSRVQYDTRTIHSNNLYQIFTYVKNMDVGRTGNVSGLLLYAKTNESITPDSDFRMSGNRISAKTLDLNQEFPVIAGQLDLIVKQFFGEEVLFKKV